ncbi:MAG TPA: DNA translocase FtsK 4TM domain-containing protein, partial [Pirellulaceae bacterium]|nr:DNA translocase FtsK 4TM domain-containing protein [Pirellulaceae bacterium]
MDAPTVCRRPQVVAGQRAQVHASMLENRVLHRDLFALALAVFVVFLGLALATYSPADPVAEMLGPLARYYKADVLEYPAAEKPQNACGRWGSLAADLMLTGLGVGAYYVVASLTVLVVVLLRRHEIDMPLVRLNGWLASIIGVSTFAALVLPEWSPGPMMGAGGMLGAIGSGWLHRHFALFGSLILATSAVVGGLLLASDYLVIRLFRFFTSGLLLVFKGRRPAPSVEAEGRGASRRPMPLNGPHLNRSVFASSKNGRAVEVDDEQFDEEEAYYDTEDADDAPRGRRPGRDDLDNGPPSVLPIRMKGRGGPNERDGRSDLDGQTERSGRTTDKSRPPGAGPLRVTGRIDSPNAGKTNRREPERPDDEFDDEESMSNTGRESDRPAGGRPLRKGRTGAADGTGRAGGGEFDSTEAAVRGSRGAAGKNAAGQGGASSSAAGPASAGPNVGRNGGAAKSGKSAMNSALTNEPEDHGDEQEPSNAAPPHFKIKKLSDRSAARAEVMAELDQAGEADANAYELPSVELLVRGEDVNWDVQEKEVRRKAKILEKTFSDFGFKVKVVEIETGPVIAQYEVELEAGLRLSKITSLADDLAIALRVPSVRIVAPIPGKNTVGIEVPNEERQVVRLREVIEETNGKIKKMRIPLFLGKDVS